MIGTTVAHYRICEILGESSTAVVYRAEDLALGRAVALKIVPHELAKNGGALASFQHEARTASSLNHPNICTTYEIGEHDGRPFIVMELLEGLPLSRLIGRQPLPLDRLVQFGIQISSALDAAHAEGVVHRDLKPSNLFVTRADQVKVLDFGLAILLPRRKRTPETDSSSRSQPWQTGMSSGGTVPYMAPEQVRGEELDSRSDLFAFGVVLYEMATGRYPFSGNSAAAIFDAITSENPLSVRLLRQDDVSGDLERIIEKAMEKDRKLRYQTAADLRADFERLKRQLSVNVPARSGINRKPSRSPRMGGVVATAGITAAVLSTFLLITRPQAPDAQRMTASVLPMEPPPPEPPLSSVATAPQPVPSTTLSAQDVGQPRRAAPGPLQNGNPPAPKLQKREPPQLASLQPAVAPPLAASVLREVDIARAKLRENLVDQALLTLRDVFTRDAGTVPIDAYFLLASIYERQGRTEDAMATYIDIRDRYRDEPRVPEALFLYAQATLRSRRPAKETEALRILETVVTQHSMSLWAGRALMARGELEERKRIYQRDEILGTSVPSALVTYRRAVEQYPNGPAAETARWRLGVLYERVKRYDLAAETFLELGDTYGTSPHDGWFRAGELYEKRLNRDDLARAAYSRVPPTSRRFRDARSRLARLE